FDITDSASFTIGALTDLAPEASFTFGEIGRTKITININTNSMGIITWALMGDLMYTYGENSTDLSTIEEYALLLVGDVEGKSVEEQEYAFHEFLVELDSEDWESYSLSVIFEASMAFIAGQNFVDASTDAELYVFNYLATDSDYIVVGYFDNFSGNQPYFLSAIVSTLEAGKSASIEVTFADGTTPSDDAV
ncbi:hypothetical protein RAF84_27705, partial [Klebsiella pneumoniae]